MKRNIFVLSLLMTMFSNYAFSQNSDLKNLGLKGEVSKVSIVTGSGYYSSTKDIYEFDSKGQATVFTLPFTELGAEITSRTASAIKGNVYYDGDKCAYTINLSKNKIIKLDYKTPNGSGKVTFSYNEKGELEKANQVYTYYTTEEYYEAGYTGVDDYVNNLNDAASAAASGDILGYAKSATKAVNSAYNVGFSAGVKTKKIKHIQEVTKTYRDYEYDDFGNWISRKVKNLESGSDIIENRTIIYDSVYYSNFYWEKVKKNQNLCEIEAYAQNDKYTHEYRNIARNYWNENIVQTVVEKYNENIDSVCRAIVSPLITSANKDVFAQKARSYFWNNIVVKERDFEKVYNYRYAKYLNWSIFDQEYVQKIVELSQQLRTDSINYLNKKADDELGKGEYKDAINTTKMVLNLEPSNANAVATSQDSYYKMIMAASGNADIAYIEEYLSLYPEGKYKSQIEDERVKYYLEKLPQEPSMTLVDSIRNMPVYDKTLAKQVKKQTKRQEYRLRRGDVCDFGIGVSGEMGNKHVAGVFGEAGFRFGYIVNWVNLYVGARFGYLSSFDAIKKPEENPEPYGYFKMLRASVPVQLRLHFAKNYNRAWYMGLGAELNFNLNPQLKYYTGTGEQEVIKDGKFVNKMTYSPRVSLGVAGSCLNFEVYGLYDLKDNFNAEYLEQMNIHNILPADTYDKTVKNKLRLGASLRIFF